MRAAIQAKIARFAACALVLFAQPISDAVPSHCFLTEASLLASPLHAQARPRTRARPAPRLPAGDHTFRLQHGGRNREYIVHMPAGTDTLKVLPVLLAFHGGGGEAEQYKNSAGLDAVSDRERFVVVYPYGMGALPRRLLTWNAGECCGAALKRNIDDVGFAIAVLDDLMRRTSIDPRRVYATGHSNGGMMAHKLAAERADRIAAIAAVAGAYNQESFTPTRAVAVMEIHSVDDPRALYNGGMGPPFPGTTTQSSHRPVMNGLSRWARNNKCGDSTVTETRTGQAGSANAGQTASLIVWKNCAGGGAVAHWKLTGVGHGWPGDLSAGGRERLIGKPTTLVVAAEEVWKFVSKVKR